MTGIAALGLVVVGLAASIPTLVLCGLVLAAWALLRPRVPGDLALPLAALGLLLATILTGTLAAAVHADVLAVPAVPAVLATIFLLYAGWSAYRRMHDHRAGSTEEPTGRPVWWRALAYVPAAGAAAVGLLQAFVPGLAMSWVFEGTDRDQHLLNLQSLQRVGILDDTGDGYPRALHFLVALVAAPGAPGRAHDLLPHNTVLMAVVVRLSLAALLATAAALVLRVVASLRLPAWLGVARRRGAAARLVPVLVRLHGCGTEPAGLRRAVGRAAGRLRASTTSGAGPPAGAARLGRRAGAGAPVAADGCGARHCIGAVVAATPGASAPGGTSTEPDCPRQRAAGPRVRRTGCGSRRSACNAAAAPPSPASSAGSRRHRGRCSSSGWSRSSR